MTTQDKENKYEDIDLTIPIKVPNKLGEYELKLIMKAEGYKIGRTLVVKLNVDI